MLYRRLAAFVQQHARIIITVWLAITASSALFAVRLPEVLGDHGLVPTGPYAQVQREIASVYPPADSERTVVMLFHHDQPMNRGQFLSHLSTVLRESASISGVRIIASPTLNRDLMSGTYAYALLQLPDSLNERREALARLDALNRDAKELTWGMTGKPVVQLDVNRSSGRDLQTAEMIGLPVAFVLLLVTFGGILAAAIPMISGIAAVTVSMAMLYAIGWSGLTELSVFVHNVVPMVGMAVSVDFALLLVSRFREEAVFFNLRSALAHTLRSAGRAIVISAGCVVLALVSTLFIRMPMFTSVALGAIVVVIVSLLVNLTLVPAMLVVLSRRITADYAIVARPGVVLRAFITAVSRRPRLAAFMASLVLMLCMLPIHTLRLSVPGPDSLPSDTPSRITADALAAQFGDIGTSQVFIVADRSKINQIDRELSVDPIVIRHRAVAVDDAVLVTIRLRGTDTSDEAMQWMRERGAHYEALGAKVGGEARYQQEVHDEIFDKLILVLTFVIASNFAVLALAFRSLIIPLKAILMNLFSITASLGIIAWLFHDGHLGLPASDIAIMIPIFIFGLSFGVSMDYGIFLLTRIEESYRQTGDNERAVKEGLAASGRLITCAAAIMIAVTAPFALAGVTGVKQLGIGIAAALLIDATLVRLVLVPSLMKLFGRWNWWLPFVRS